MRRNVAALFCLVLILALGGCDEPSPAGLPMAKIKIGTQIFQIEVARTDAQQEKGLMERDSMPDDHGMIFIFPAEHLQSFWMKNTRFPLDIVFLDGSGKVVSIRSMKAYDITPTSSDAPAQYAIEIQKGAASACGVKIGDAVTIPPEARATR